MKPGKLLAKLRAQKLREDDQQKLRELRAALVGARARRRKALALAVSTCRRTRKSLAIRVAAYRAAERGRIALEVKQLRLRARAQCQARKHRIRTAGGTAVEKRRAHLEAEGKLQAQLARLAQHAKNRMAKHRTKAKERRAESDDYVRSNLPPELVGVFNAVRGQIKQGPRTTRTEAFLEWAESHPDEVLQHQSNDADREVARLVREHEATGARLAKGRRHYRELAEAVPF